MPNDIGSICEKIKLKETFYFIYNENEKDKSDYSIVALDTLDRVFYFAEERM